LQEFEEHQYSFEVSDNNAISLVGQYSLQSLKTYQNGFFEIQDFASQEIGRALPIKPGSFVWDCCAGGGGKTIQIASYLNGKGAVYASDIREYKLEEVKKRAKRAGFFQVRCLPWSGDQLPQFPLEIQKRSGFDVVFVDAPCSSSGTWRRNPDAKYRSDLQGIQSLSCLQKKILTNASRAVKSQGFLCYATCSWFCDENEMVIENFIKENPDFEIQSMSLLGHPKADSDTMFVSILKKKV